MVETTMIDGPARRRRRSHRPAEPVMPATGDAEPEVIEAELAEAATSKSSSGRGRARSRRLSDDRGWRDLAGTSPSQLGVSGALRARDVARPDEAELAAAERELVVVRRQWSPPEDTGA